jgi:ParB family chromosome partitioning protein
MTRRKSAPPPTNGIKLIPLHRLKKSPRNARKVPHTKEEIEALAASIKAHGLLQNPVVEPELDRAEKPTGYFLVTVGEGRRQALLLRARRKEIGKAHPVRCMVDTDHDPFEISLAENTIRSAMHPADQFDAFYALHTKQGMRAEDIGARFGVTPAVVKQRLKLAAVSPGLIAAYRNGEMTLDQLTAFAITDDVAAQERVWAEIGRGAERQDILAALTHAQVPATDPRAIFVGPDAYRAAGGAVVQDLFDAEGGGYFADAELLLRLASEKLERLSAAIKAEGWKWVEVMPRFDHAAVADCRRIYPLPKELSKADQKKLDALEAEYEALEYDGTDEAAAAIARIEEAVAALQGEPIFDPADVTRAGTVVSLAHNGEPRIERGFIRSEDDSRPEKATRAKPAGGAAPLSEKLVTELTAYKTIVLRDALGGNPEAALTALTHTLALAACFRGAAEFSCIQVSGRSPNLLSFLPSIEESAPGQRVAARHEAWTTALPGDPAALWDYLLKQPSDQRLALLAHCVAFTVDAVQRSVHGEGQIIHADQVARVLGLDMAASWTPTATNYLSRVSKERILEAVREGVSPEAAENISTLPKAAMAEAAETRLAGRGWLPAPLRIPLAPPEDDCAKAKPKRPPARRARVAAAAAATR